MGLPPGKFTSVNYWGQCYLPPVSMGLSYSQNLCFYLSARLVMQNIAESSRKKIALMNTRTNRSTNME